MNRKRFSLVFLVACTVLLCGSMIPACAAETRRTELVLLGTGGGPRPNPVRYSPSSALLIDGMPIVIDCGNGVSRQLVLAGIPLASLKYIFITHHHSDHISELGALLLLSWASGLNEPIHVFGPPPLEASIAAAFEQYRFDIETRVSDEGRPDLRLLVEVHEFDTGGVVHESELFKATAARNNHPPIEQSYAYRFDTPDRSVVFSGDTTYDKNVIALAKGADILVHEVLYTPGIESILQKVSNAAGLRKHLLASHTPVEDLGRIAREAGVKSLVLNHIVPTEIEEFDELSIKSIQKEFSGEVIVGRDLDRF
jgi:ribonuclease BN (tRNA processing enzyme)